MSTDLEKTALFRFLEANSKVYAPKILELRKAVEGWLKYVPTTFPHYTSHTVDHSDEIVLRVSELLFKKPSSKRPVVDLSAVEAYILCAAAYLHDAGMVVSDKEKQEILDSGEWKKWTTGDGGGAKRWKEIADFRVDAKAKFPKEEDRPICDFIADRQVRFLIAEFVRRTHHIRASGVLEQHKDQLARFSFDDPILHRTIRDVCVSHGLSPHELEDRDRYPDRRDVRGEKVNVRFCAILLRLGDLLDMSSDRACPLLMNAASPLPADSLAHWTQYRRLTHFLVAPDKIEITAECQSQDEHRVLRDWCEWLAKEAKEARTLVARCQRHEKWQVPDTTIDIRKAPRATYVPVDWRFELDNEAVFERLIKDVYHQPEDFIRELIQNALDATRCRMYADLPEDQRPDYPTQVPEEIRNRYPIRISLSEVEVENELSGEKETRQVLAVEDPGIGMDREIVQRYFLQVGRSYYTTDEFRSRFRFVPTSRFGVGFLSIFGSSDRVTVETYKPTSAAEPKPIRITLTGPRSYFLVEEIERHSTGTSIAVRLKEPFEPGELTRLVSSWCRRVEFPIIVNDLRTKTTIAAEGPEHFVYEMPDVTDEDATFRLRSFPIDHPGIDGELYVLAYVQNGVEYWDRVEYATDVYPKKHPLATEPDIPSTLVCVNGLETTGRWGWSGTGEACVRLDYRRELSGVIMSRDPEYMAYAILNASSPDIGLRWAELLTNHLDEVGQVLCSDFWLYKQRLMTRFPIKGFWDTVPETMRIYRFGDAAIVSLADLQSLDSLTVVVTSLHRSTSRFARRGDKADVIARAGHISAAIIEDDLSRVTSTDYRAALFLDRWVSKVELLGNGLLAVTWSLVRNGETQDCDLGHNIRVFDGIVDHSVVGIATHIVRGSHRTLLLNQGHPLVVWLGGVSEAVKNDSYGLCKEQLAHLARLLTWVTSGEKGRMELQKYLHQWGDIPGLPEELYPPQIELTEDMFRLKPLEGYESG